MVPATDSFRGARGIQSLEFLELRIVGEPPKWT